MAPIGLAIAGPISDFFSIQSWFIAAGVVCVGLGAFGILNPVVFNIESNNPNKKKEIQPEQPSARGVIETEPKMASTPTE